MAPSLTSFDRVSRRTVLKASAFLGAGLFAEPVAAQDELVLDIQQEAINPDEEGRIPVRVKGYPKPDDWTLSDVWFGHVDQFVTEKGAEFVALPEEPDGVLAQPVSSTKGLPIPKDLIEMEFRTQDIVFSDVSGDEVEMGLGIFTDRTAPNPTFDTEFQGWVEGLG